MEAEREKVLLPMARGAAKGILRWIRRGSEEAGGGGNMKEITLRRNRG